VGEGGELRVERQPEKAVWPYSSSGISDFLIHSLQLCFTGLQRVAGAWLDRVCVSGSNRSTADFLSRGLQVEDRVAWTRFGA
jgi:hypothetical protein